MKNELDQLRERLVLEEKDSKYLRDNISERETQIAALRAELEDSKENGEKLRSQLD